MNLIKNSLENLKERLNDLPADTYYEEGDYLVIFSVKEVDDETNAFSVGVCKKGTDVLFSNFVKTGTLKDIEQYLQEPECFSKASEYITNLLKKAEEHEV